MELVLTVVSGLAWTIVYIEAIRIGFRDRSYAIPAAALALNFSWESIYAVNGLMTGLSVQAVVNVVWALADLVIVLTFVRFGRRELPKFVSQPMFLGWAVLLFAASYGAQALFIVEFGTDLAARYSAFLQNALMSGLFIAMLVARRGLRGQTLMIAIAKWLGTLAPTILLGVIHWSPLILCLGLICSAFDLVYVGLVLWARRNPDALLDQGSAVGAESGPGRA